MNGSRSRNRNGRRTFQSQVPSSLRPVFKVREGNASLSSLSLRLPKRESSNTENDGHRLFAEREHRKSLAMKSMRYRKESQGGLPAREVNIAFNVISFGDIDTGRLQFQAKFQITCRWHDQHDAVKAELMKKESALLKRKGDVLTSAKDWVPDLICANGLGNADRSSKTQPTRQTNDGGLETKMMFEGKFQTLFDLSMFPFDVQLLSMVVRPMRADFNLLRLINSQTHHVSHNVHFNGWKRVTSSERNKAGGSVDIPMRKSINSTTGNDELLDSLREHANAVPASRSLLGEQEALPAAHANFLEGLTGIHL